MTEVVGGRDALARGLSAMRARVEPKTDTGANLEAHADLLAEWLGTTDPVQQALLAGYNLTAGDVSRARADLAALRSEQRTAVGVGSSRFDGPAVNALDADTVIGRRGSNGLGRVAHASRLHGRIASRGPRCVDTVAVTRRFVWRIN